MNNGAFGEGYPYTNFHDLNLDWVIKIVKEFLDKYTTIQDLIDQGISDINNLTSESLEDLQTKYETLSDLLDQWYNTHSEDIATQLASALLDLNTWYNQHVDYLDDILQIKTNTFNSLAEAKTQECLESIPADYSDLADIVEEFAKIVNMHNILNYNTGVSFNENKYYVNGGYTSSPTYSVFVFPVESGHSYTFGCYIRYLTKSSVLITEQQNAGYTYTADADTYVYATVRNSDRDSWIVVESPDTPEKGLTYGEFGINPDILKQETGDDFKSIMSQKAVTDEISKISPVANILNILNYPNCTFVENKYFTNGQYYDSPSYSVFIIPVKNGVSYTFGCYTRYINKVDSNITEQQNAGYTYTADADTNIYVTMRNSDINRWTVVIYPNDYTKSVPYGHVSLSDKVMNMNINLTDKYQIYRGNDQSYNMHFPNSIKRNKTYNFSCKFNSFGKVTINLGYNGSYENSFEFNSTTFIRTTAGSEKPPVTHNLSLNYYLNITIEMGYASFKITAISNDTSFEYEFNYASNYNEISYSIEDMTGTDIILSWTCNDFNNDIWIYGDSYITYSPERWIYYLITDNLDKNCLIDGYAGENSTTALASLKNYLPIAHPKYIIWSVGMNDGTDTGETPNSTWLANVNELEDICTTYNIELVLCTIPSVPSINNENKSTWVRNSGHKYIDFARAVENSNGVWYSGMLSQDNVHPTEKGAKALYEEAVIDFPHFRITK